MPSYRKRVDLYTVKNVLNAIPNGWAKLNNRWIPIRYSHHVDAYVIPTKPDGSFDVGVS